MRTAIKTYAGKALLTLALLSGATSLFAKSEVSLDEDYRLAVVTGDGVNIRTGAGAHFPIAYVYFEDWNGKKVKNEAPPAYKGQKLWVKDAGDWWQINHPGTVTDGDSKQFISKKFCQLVETDCFDMESITTPQVWTHAETSENEFGDEIIEYNVLTVYPGGLVVTQYYSDYGTTLTLGKVNKERTAVFNDINTMISETGDEPRADQPLALSADIAGIPPHLTWSIGENRKSSFTYAGNELKYVDISEVPEETWIGLVKELKKSDDFRSVRQYRTNADSFMTYDTLTTNCTRQK